MASVINTNIASLNSQRNLTTSQGSLSTSLQRLSSGLRINSAKDDAAGLAISDRMSSQIRGMSQAMRNANDGVSMSQTAEGALSSSGEILQRIRELAVQSSNATNSASDRQALQTEVGQLASELNRIAQTTTFNGQALLDGTMGTATFQVGADANQTIQANGANFLTNTYGNNRIANDAVQVTAASLSTATSTLDVNGVRGSVQIDTDIGETAKSIASKVNNQTAETGVTASAQTDVNLALTGGESFEFTIVGDNTVAGNEATVTFSVGAGADEAADYASAINAINAQSSKTGVTAQYDAENGGLKLSHASGADIVLNNTSTNTNFVVANYDASGAPIAGGLDIGGGGPAVAHGRVTFDSESSFSIADGGTGFSLDNGGADATSTLNAVADLDVTDFKGAQLAIKIADAALASVNNQRAAFGALQSRFSSTISNLSATTENLSASRSRIVDTDFAAETASLTRAQILQQAGTAMLAQANSLPNGVLSLLRG